MDDNNRTNIDPFEEPADEFNDEFEQETATPDLSDESETTHFLTLLVYMQRALDAAVTLPMYKKKQLVDVNGMREILKNLYDNLPPALQYARKLYAERDRVIRNAENTALNMTAGAQTNADAIIREAKEQAAEIVANANAYADEHTANAEERAKKLVDEHEITKRAEAEGRQRVEQAQAEALNIRRNVVRQCNEKINALQNSAVQMANELARVRDEFQKSVMQPQKTAPQANGFEYPSEDTEE